MSVENRSSFETTIRGKREYYKPIVYVDTKSTIGYQYNYEQARTRRRGLINSTQKKNDTKAKNQENQYVNIPTRDLLPFYNMIL